MLFRVKGNSGWDQSEHFESPRGQTDILRDNPESDSIRWEPTKEPGPFQQIHRSRLMDCPGRRADKAMGTTVTRPAAVQDYRIR